ncbi:hypothetical protein BKA65DRAFT_504097 [Rhexocercosporidium sp. MPI-PUGE-AT-0058]|nr:hypothetical protein BKA65DRAFT_504097 [Rhexocercosporidium sp. MPI-PUGE-AT-0058]
MTPLFVSQAFPHLILLIYPLLYSTILTPPPIFSPPLAPSSHITNQATPDNTNRKVESTNPPSIHSRTEQQLQLQPAPIRQLVSCFAHARQGAHTPGQGGKRETSVGPRISVGRARYRDYCT